MLRSLTLTALLALFVPAAHAQVSCSGCDAAADLDTYDLSSGSQNVFRDIYDDGGTDIGSVKFTVVVNTLDGGDCTYIALLGCQQFMFGCAFDFDVSWAVSYTTPYNPFTEFGWSFSGGKIYKGTESLPGDPDEVTVQEETDCGESILLRIELNHHLFIPNAIDQYSTDIFFMSLECSACAESEAPMLAGLSFAKADARTNPRGAPTLLELTGVPALL